MTASYTFSLRQASTTDLADVTRLQKAFYVEESLQWKDTVHNATRQLLSDARIGLVLVVQLADTHGADAIVGYLTLTYGFCLELGGRDAFVDELFVSPAQRGRGLGKALLHEALRVAELNGVKTVLLEVAAPNPQKLGLYQSVGFSARPFPLMIRVVDKHS